MLVLFPEVRLISNLKIFGDRDFRYKINYNPLFIYYYILKAPILCILGGNETMGFIFRVIIKIHFLTYFIFTLERYRRGNMQFSRVGDRKIFASYR